MILRRSRYLFNVLCLNQLVKQEMSSLIETARKSVSILINDMERESIIKQESGKFLRLNIPNLILSEWLIFMDRRIKTNVA
ncbi:MAG: hypothetical protein HC892_05340 [Saprospiraceae bacterium]|nr:hypothetical protein [Saprospiraceae bacterium]